GCSVHGTAGPAGPTEEEQSHKRENPAMTTIAVPTIQAEDGFDHIGALRAQLDGNLVLPGDGAYDETRQLVSIVYDRRPAAIVRAASTEDVALAVRFAREHGMELAVRSGG